LLNHQDDSPVSRPDFRIVDFNPTNTAAFTGLQFNGLFAAGHNAASISQMPRKLRIALESDIDGAEMAFDNIRQPDAGW
jgi:hypothetical protein